MDDFLIVGARFGLYVALMLLYGVAAFGLYGLRHREQHSVFELPFGTALAGAGLAALLFSFLGLVTLAANMMDVSIASVDRDALRLVLFETTIGTAWLARTVAIVLAVLAAITHSRLPRLALAFVTIAGAVALASMAWAGHGAGGEGLLGWLHLVSDIVHLLAAGAWVGALSVLIFMLLSPSCSALPQQLALSHQALARFSLAGTIMVGLIVLSGLMNGWVLIGAAGLGSVPSTLYGQLLAAKLCLFTLMLFLAAANRFRLAPAFKVALADGDHRKSLTALRTSLALETGCAIVILALVAWLGTLAPPGAGF